MMEPLATTKENVYKIDQTRAYRVKLYFQIMQHFKGILDAWWRLQFGDPPPSQNERC